jgi:hypothetical protein
MSTIDIVLFVMMNIASFLFGGYVYLKQGFKMGYQAAAEDERLVMGLAITRAYKPNQDEVLNKVATEYKQILLEAQQMNVKNK